CVITATRNSSRCGRSRATATSRMPIRARCGTECDASFRGGCEPERRIHIRLRLFCALPPVSVALNLGLQLQALIRFDPHCSEQSKTIAATPSDPCTSPVGRAAGYGRPITFFCVSNILASNLQPWVVSGTADLGRRRRRTREKKQ